MKQPSPSYLGSLTENRPDQAEPLAGGPQAPRRLTYQV